MKPLSLGTLDICVLVGYVVALGFIGWWAARKTTASTTDYFLANRSIPWLVTAASFMATIISALTFIGTPAEGYGADYRYLFSNIGDISAAFFVALVFLPVFQKYGVTSIYEIISRRFGFGVRTTSSAYFLVSRVLASTVRIVAVAKVLEVVSGRSIPYSACVVIVIGTILAYTTIGGGRAIAWTDLMQFILLMTGAIVAMVYLISFVPGGLPAIIDAGQHAVKPDGTVYNKFNFLEMLKPENLEIFFLISIWGFFQSSAAYGTDQDMAQRLLACNNPLKARWSLMMSGLVSVFVTFLFLSIGVGLYAYAKAFPELTAGMDDNDHIFPRFILYTMPDGLKGLLLAAVASAAMGSSDSALASLSTAFTLDFYKPYFGKGASEAQCVRVSRFAFVGFGLAMGVFALLLQNLDSLLWMGFRVVAFTYGPLLGLFSVAILTRWKVSPKLLIGTMLTITMIGISLALGAWLQVAYWKVKEGGWFLLHTQWWRYYVIVGALLVPLICFLFREGNEEEPRVGS